MAENKNRNKKMSKRRLRRQVRKTFGGLFLATAVAVAAIPTTSYEGGNVAAADTGTYTHTVSYWIGDSATVHSEAFPILKTEGTTTMPATVKARSVFITLSDSTIAKNTYGTSSTYADKAMFDETTYANNYKAVSSQIPICDPATTHIYSTGDGDFQFAYVPDTGVETDSGNKSAVILGYNHQGSLAGGTLTIPDSVDAYLNFTDNSGSGKGLVAVGKSANFLFYTASENTLTKETEYCTQVTQPEQKTNADGELMFYIGTDTTTEYSDSEVKKLKEDNPNTTYTTTKVMVDVTRYTNYAPCFYTDRSVWENKSLAYYNVAGFKPPATDSTHAGDTANGYDEAGNLYPTFVTSDNESYGRITGAMVQYIGNQYLEATSTGWDIAGLITEAKKGIFYNQGNIVSLVVGEDLSGIGNYAFSGCTAMTSITTGNGIMEIGNHAFDGCRNLASVNIPKACKLVSLGAYAFNNCQALTSFTVPISIQNIGDGAFKGCRSMTSLIDLHDSGLTSLGSFVFIDCEALTDLTFPATYNETIELSSFEGCLSLGKLVTENTSFNIIESTTCNFNWPAFLNEGLKENFYIEAYGGISGRADSTIHKTCTDNEVSFKYFGDDLYELTKKEEGLLANGNSATPTVTYQVNSSNSLANVVFNGSDTDGYVTSLTFPKYIGPHYIESIGAGAFEDKCTLRKITIPATIKSIGANAFQGCHNLRYVTFEENPELTIGANAFKTQEVSSHDGDCRTITDSSGNVLLYDKNGMTDANNKPTVQLHFVGVLGSSSPAYNYAMSDSGRYNNGTQQHTYIEYLSGWPTCITVQYVEEMDAIGNVTGGHSELVDFPTTNDLDSYKDAEYFTDEQKLAASTANSTPPANLTEDQKAFLKSATTLTIPAGVDAIQDGLFYSKTHPTTGDHAGSKVPAMTVEIYGMDNIETGYKWVYADAGTTDTDGTEKGNYVTYYKVEANGDYKLDAAGQRIVAYNPSTDGEILDGSKNIPDPTISDFAGSMDTIEKLYIYDTSSVELGEAAFANGVTKASLTADPNVTAPTAESSALNTVYLDGTAKKLGAYAFNGNEILTDVNVSPELEEMGNRPFTGCTALSDVNFEGSDNFTCDNSIIYSLKNGSKDQLIEYLEGRSSTSVRADETAGITSIKEEAFANTEVKKVDLSETAITDVPEKAFYHTRNLDDVILPDTIGTISDYAFMDSAIAEIEIPETNTLIAQNAFRNVDDQTAADKGLLFITPLGGFVEKFATVANNFRVEAMKQRYTITFVAYDADLGTITTIDVRKEKEGTTYYAEQYPELDDYPGYRFVEWSQKVENLSGDMTTTAKYEDRRWTVSFYDEDGTTLLFTEYVSDGEDASEYLTKKDPSKDGYTFDGWIPAKNLKNVTENREVTASYKSGRYHTFYYFESEEDFKNYNYTFYTEVPMADGSATFILPAAPSVEIPGYTFSNWGASEDAIKAATEPTKYYAQYVADGVSGIYTVKYWSSYEDFNTYKTDGTGTPLYSYTMPSGGSAPTAMAAPEKEGYKFVEWRADGSLTNISQDTNAYPYYEIDDGNGGNSGNGGSGSDKTKYTVTFYDDDKTTVLGTNTVYEGDTATPPVIPTKSGYTFSKWVDADGNALSLTNVKEDFNAYASYTEGGPAYGETFTVNYYSYDGSTLIDSQKVLKGENAPNIVAPQRDGYTFIGWVPSLTNVTSDRDVAAAYNSSDGAKNYYTLTVKNGSGSGSYVVGAKAIIVAEPPSSNLEFSNWQILPANATIASKDQAATIITMPAEDVAVVANFKTKSNSSGSTGSSNTIQRPSGNATINNGGNTVVIEKNGFSNTGVVSAVVTGSSDNFTIKITDSSEASEAIVKALLAEYGDLSNIKYFPMDISLYDASGNVKIKDTTGLKITITLPIPDSLKEYAGNNKVAGVVNDRLDKLTPRFTTISGVPCITFTAEHFSPYVIYVDTQNLSAGSTIDTTPKTGDRIHPKWFLSAGLALLSVVLFMKKDSKPKKKLVKA